MRVLFVSPHGDSLGLAHRVAQEGHHVEFYTPRRELRGTHTDVLTHVPEWRPAATHTDLFVSDTCDAYVSGLGNTKCLPTALKTVAIACARPAVVDLLSRAGVNFLADHNEPPSGTVLDTSSGVRVVTEGWFNGSVFMRPLLMAVLDRRALTGNLGPLTPGQGTTLLATQSNTLTAQTVERLTSFLRCAGYRGPVSLDCWVDADAAYALDVLPALRFDTAEAFAEGLGMELGQFLFDAANGTRTEFPFTSDTAICVRVSALPPHEVGELPDDARRHFFMCGQDTLIAKATATGRASGGDYTREARRRVYRALARFDLRDKCYRTDIGVEAQTAFTQLSKWGWT